MNGFQLGMGADWVLGVAGATRYPTDGRGGATATNTSSVISGAGEILLLGIFVNTTAAVAYDVVDHAGDVIPGLSLTASPAVGWHPFGPFGVKYTAAIATGRGNVGIKLGAAAVASLVYKRLA
jgi:hypothetical protein